MWVNMSIFLERDAIFGMDTQVTPESILGYVILISKVIWGHQWSTAVNWGQNCKMTLRDAIFCMYTHMIPRNNVDYVNLTSKVNGGHQRWKLRGHWRSKIAEVIPYLKKTLEMQFFTCMFLLYLFTSDIIKYWPPRSLEVTRGKKI